MTQLTRQQVLDMIDGIAKEWDGCAYDDAMIPDIGAAIRRAAQKRVDALLRNAETSEAAQAAASDTPLDKLRVLVGAYVPKATPDAVEATNALRALAFALESVPGATLPRFFLELPEGDEREARVRWSERKADGYHLCISVPPAPFPADLGAKYSIEFDGFKGTVIGAYKRLDGEEGVVMQQDGTKVVHVYRRKWLQPA